MLLGAQAAVCDANMHKLISISRMSRQKKNIVEAQNIRQSIIYSHFLKKNHVIFPQYHPIEMISNDSMNWNAIWMHRKIKLLAHGFYFSQIYARCA